MNPCYWRAVWRAAICAALVLFSGAGYGQALCEFDPIFASTFYTPPNTGFSLGGNVSGLLAGRSLLLANSNGDTLVVPANGVFQFGKRLASGSAFAVTVKHQPIGATCSVTGGSGSNVSANVTSVSIACTTSTATNPVFANDFPDPSVVRHSDNYWYAYGTGGKVARSTNLATWEWQPTYQPPGAGFNWGTPNADVWAPDIVKIGDLFFNYYSLSLRGDTNPGIGFATAPSPVGPWTDHGKLFLSLEIGVKNSIDPVVVKAHDCRLYLIWGSFYGNYVLELTADGLALKDGANAVTTKKLIAGAPYQGFAGSRYEGMFVRYKNGYYYLFASTGSCCLGANSTYAVVVFRSRSPTGPYVDRNGTTPLSFDTIGESVIKGETINYLGPGHNSIAEDDAGNWWLVYHGYQVGIWNERRLMVDRLVWDSEGWPSVGTPGNAPSRNPFSR